MKHFYIGFEKKAFVSMARTGMQKLRRGVAYARKPRQTFTYAKKQFGKKMDALHGRLPKGSSMMDRKKAIENAPINKVYRPVGKALVYGGMGTAAAVGAKKMMTPPRESAPQQWSHGYGSGYA